MEIKDLKSSNIIFVAQGNTKETAAEYCTNLKVVKDGFQTISNRYRLEPIHQPNDKTNWWFYHISRIWEDWGNLFMESYGPLGLIERFYIKEVEPCHHCKHRLARQVGLCPAKYESK